jgi:hypothetical protein
MLTRLSFLTILPILPLKTANVVPNVSAITRYSVISQSYASWKLGKIEKNWKILRFFDWGEMEQGEHVCELVERLVVCPIILFGSGLYPTAYIPCSYQKMVVFYPEHLGAVLC